MSDSIIIRNRTPKQRRLRTRYGPWAVVTGASDGIGREIATRLAEAGLNLLLAARRGDVLEEFASTLRRQHGIQTRVVVADFSQPTATEAVLAATDGLETGLLVAAAGFGSSGEFINADLGAELAMVDVNCRAVLALCHLFGKRFAGQRRGGIVLMSSLLAFQGVPRAANYAATKAYIQTFAEGLHAELAPLGVDVLASAPGPVRSGFAARADMQMNLALTPKDVAQATLEALGHRVTVRPGWLSVLLEASMALLPRGARVGIMARVMGGMTRHRA